MKRETGRSQNEGQCYSFELITTRKVKERKRIRKRKTTERKQEGASFPEKLKQRGTNVRQKGSGFFLLQQKRQVKGMKNNNKEKVT